MAESESQASPRPVHAAESHLRSPGFHALAARKDLISWILTVVAAAVYFGFLFLIAFRKDLVGSRLTADMNWGIPLGIGVIVVSWLLTGIYVWWANRTYDVMVAELRRKWGR